MIILMVSEYKYFILFDKAKLTENQFISKCKVEENSFACDLMIKVYNTFFDLDIDLESKYIKYYLDEYTNLEEYLYSKYLINREFIELIMRTKRENEKIYYIDLLEKTDYGISTLINDELIEKLNNILMEVSNENQN
ncbi:hypothetical protein CLPUN_27060 [Clostridium puniceum]|uniref:Uncharacterized protein n=1 Tax=Clostridium puniceum TaxID=29367 RepID=A0A1S8TFS1_9CLOT|nr:hypothetical protein [Clostridium puniceum]OOM76474.1 hypothetical protein CLPUN_27060 [Clostridium puniceum]